MSHILSGHVGSLAGASRELRAPAAFVLAGVEWAGPEKARIELRARRSDGGWSRWVDASVLGHDPDGEAPRHAYVGQPVWFGPSDAVQLRASRPVEDVSVHFVPLQAVGGRSGGAVAATASAVQRHPPAQPRLAAGAGQPHIIARRAWAGNGAGPAYTPSYGDVRMAFVHHTDNPNGYGAAQVPAMILAIYQFHRYVNGWSDIGYNFVVDLYGGIWEARAGGIDQAVVGAQAGGYNFESTGIALLGTFSSVLPTPAAMDALKRLLAWKLPLHGVPVTGDVVVEVDPGAAFYTRFRPGQRVKLPRIAGHRDGCTTDCPGSAMYGRLPAVRAAVARMVPRRLELGLAARGGTGARSTYLSLASVVVTAGESLTLWGALTEPGSGAGSRIAGAEIELQSLVPGSPAAEGHPHELLLGTAATGADGRYSLALTPQTNLLVRALHRVAPSVASPLIVVGVAPAVSLTAAPAAGQQPGHVAVSGTVAPVKPHVLIDIHHATGRRKLIRTVKLAVASDGTFDGTLRLRSGSYLLVARTAADADNIAGASAPVRVSARG